MPLRAQLQSNRIAQVKIHLETCYSTKKPQTTQFSFQNWFSDWQKWAFVYLKASYVSLGNNRPVSSFTVFARLHFLTSKKDICVGVRLLFPHFVFLRIVLDTFFWLLPYLNCHSWKNVSLYFYYILFLLLSMNCLIFLLSFFLFFRKASTAESITKLSLLLGVLSLAWTVSYLTVIRKEASPQDTQTLIQGTLGTNKKSSFSLEKGPYMHIDWEKFFINKSRVKMGRETYLKAL